MGLVSMAYCKLNGKELETVEKISYDLPDVSTARKTMNRDGEPIDFTHGVAEYSFDLEAAIQDSNPEVDWIDLWQNKTKFSFVHSEGDVLFLWRNVIVAQVGASFDTGGESRRTIKCKALGLRIQSAA